MIWPRMETHQSAVVNIPLSLRFRHSVRLACLNSLNTAVRFLFFFPPDYSSRVDFVGCFDRGRPGSLQHDVCHSDFLLGSSWMGLCHSCSHHWVGRSVGSLMHQAVCVRYLLDFLSCAHGCVKSRVTSRASTTHFSGEPSHTIK